MGQWAMSLPVTLWGALRMFRQWQVQVCALGLFLCLGTELHV